MIMPIFTSGSVVVHAQIPHETDHASSTVAASERSTRTRHDAETNAMVAM